LCVGTKRSECDGRDAKNDEYQIAKHPTPFQHTRQITAGVGEVVFEKTPLSQAFAGGNYIFEHDPSHNQLNLFDF
jgi:hypothetical protein